MSAAEIRTDLVLVHSTQTAKINMPVDQVDVANWLLNLPDAEYQRCAPPDHIAAGSSTTDDGRPMSINVEQVGGALVVQHYVAEVCEPDHCRMVSISDIKTPLGWNTIQVIWDLAITALDDGTCQLANMVISHPTVAFLDSLEEASQAFEETARGLQDAVTEHNERETPLFAASMERRARSAAMS